MDGLHLSQCAHKSMWHVCLFLIQILYFRTPNFGMQPKEMFWTGRKFSPPKLQATDMNLQSCISCLGMRNLSKLLQTGYITMKYLLPVFIMGKKISSLSLILGVHCNPLCFCSAERLQSRMLQYNQMNPFFISSASSNHKKTPCFLCQSLQTEAGGSISLHLLTPCSAIVFQVTSKHHLLPGWLLLKKKRKEEEKGTKKTLRQVGFSYFISLGNSASKENVNSYRIISVMGGEPWLL